MVDFDGKIAFETGLLPERKSGLLQRDFVDLRNPRNSEFRKNFLTLKKAGMSDGFHYSMPSSSEKRNLECISSRLQPSQLTGR